MTPEALLTAGRGLVIAPAGCGKTHLLVETVRRHTDGRMLVLTHTRAGVAAIRSRLSSISQQRYRVTTLDAWAAWLALAFPKASGFVPTGTTRDYDLAKTAAHRLLTSKTFSRLLAATYSRVLVDEYQDCGRRQHAMITAIAEAVPTVAFGDPMQAIFGFNDPLPRWPDVEAFFGAPWTLSTPHRWDNAGEPAFGRWVLDRRRDLEAGRKIDLRTGSPNVRWIPLPSGLPNPETFLVSQLPTPKRDTTLLVLNDSMQRQERRELARCAGNLAVVEAADLPDLMAAARRIDAASGMDRVRALLDFATQAVTGIETAKILTRLDDLTTGAGSEPRSVLETELIEVARGGGIERSLNALRAGNFVYRPDFFECMCEAARTESGSLADAAHHVLARRANAGRRVEPRAIGSTLLLKGLEAEHAVVFDGDGMDARHLYVAISRASRSLTVVSQSPVLPAR